MAELFHTATEFVANELTFIRGDPSLVTSVGVYHTTDPNEVPMSASFTTVTLVTGGALAEAGKIDVLSLIGPKAGADLNLSVTGDYQRFVLVSTSTEDIIRKVDVLEIL